MLEEFIDFCTEVFPSINPYTIENVKSAMAQFQHEGKTFSVCRSSPLDYLAQGDIFSELPFTFFVNYQINNIRLYKGMNGQNEFTSGFLAGQTENHISVVIDINDRYDFNYHKDFKSDPSRLNQILTLTDKAIQNFDKLVFNGELII